MLVLGFNEGDSVSIGDRVLTYQYYSERKGYVCQYDGDTHFIKGMIKLEPNVIVEVRGREGRSARRARIAIAAPRELEIRRLGVLDPDAEIELHHREG